MNAIRLAHAVATLPDDASLALVKQARRHRAIHTRAVMDDRREHILFTTLEPCPMCTVCLINAGIDRVIIGAADPASGTLDASRLDRLPPLWSELAKAIGLTASFCQSEKPEEAETYLPRELHDELLDMFTASRKELDEELGNTGVLDFAKAIANGWAAINGNSRADSKYS
jgi:tRNA(Arg) A34 adenosine deaminase TadA